MDMDEQERDELLQMSEKEKRDAARFTVKYPNIELNYEVLEKEDICSGSTVNVAVSIEREDEVSGPIVAPYFPQVNFTSDFKRLS